MSKGITEVHSNCKKSVMEENEVKHKNPWKKTLKLESLLQDCLIKDFSRLLKDYDEGDDKTYEKFCTLAKLRGITLVFHWCSPRTKKKACHTRAFVDKVIYLILNTAKEFWISPYLQEDCLCPDHWSSETELRFRQQIGGFFLTYLLHGSQPSLSGEEVKVDIAANEINLIEKFVRTIEERIKIEGPEKEFYEGIHFIYTKMKIEGALRPVVVSSEMGMSLFNLKK